MNNLDDLDNLDAMSITVLSKTFGAQVGTSMLGKPKLYKGFSMPRRHDSSPIQGLYNTHHNIMINTEVHIRRL